MACALVAVGHPRLLLSEHRDETECEWAAPRLYNVVSNVYLVVAGNEMSVSASAAGLFELAVACR